jgi:hypothetical protein
MASAALAISCGGSEAQNRRKITDHRQVDKQNLRPLAEYSAILEIILAAGGILSTAALDYAGRKKTARLSFAHCIFAKDNS